MAPRATAPPKAFFVDFSNPLDPNRSYTNTVQLYRSANNTPGATADGDFGLDPTFSNPGPGVAVSAGGEPDGHAQELDSGGGCRVSPGYLNRLQVRAARRHDPGA